MDRPVRWEESMKTGTLLLVDDDRQILESMSGWLREQGYHVDTASNLNESVGKLGERPYDLVLADVCLQDEDGTQLLELCRQSYPQTSVVMISGYGTVTSAMEAIRGGAFDYLTKPIIDQELEMTIERALGQREVIRENINLKQQLDQRFGLDNVVGRDDRMLRVFDVIDSVADTKATVLITGESGTGKSLIARAIHRRSSRRDKPFVEVACGALPEQLLESELFGHVAGAFTGTSGDKIGKFLQADGGTIFLDEIGTSSQGMQVKLLRVLQEFEFEPVGGTETHHVDTRVILATNENLTQMVAEGTFRQDLYYRVNVINIELPPLRERVSDIPGLANHFLQEVNQDSAREVRGFTDEAISALQRYNWPGNVRELQNVVERGVLLGKDNVVGVDDLPPQVSAAMGVSIQSNEGRTLKEALEGPERQIILEVLEKYNWNRHETADALGVNRTTLYKKMKRLGLDEKRYAAI